MTEKHETNIRSRYPATEPPKEDQSRYIEWLLSQHRLHESVLDHMTDAVIVTDHAAKVTFINHAGETLLDRSIDSLRSHHILECFRDEAGKSAKWMGRNILRLEGVRDEPQFVLRPDKSRVPVLLSLFPVTVEGVLVRVVGIMRDQTEIERRNFELEEANAKLAIANKKLEEIACTDEMTGLMNRRAFLDSLNEQIALARRRAKPLALVYIDPNRFKPVNDVYGHKQGDRVIREVAHRFRGALYATDIVARYGGDEFVAVLPRTSGSEVIAPLKKLAKRLCFDIELEHPQTAEKTQKRITVAIGGIVRSGSRIPSAEEFIECAEQMMYLSKGKKSSYELDIQD